MEHIINEYKELTGELPDYIKDDIHCKKYMALTLNNKILSIWERKESMWDHNVEEVDKTTGETKVVRNYYGEWTRMSQKDVDKLNEERKKNNKILSHPETERLSARERDLEAARSLLAALRARAEEGN